MRRYLSPILFALLLAGCGHAFQTATPPGFVELEDQESYGYDWRATTADGLVVAVRDIANEPKGPLEFWTRAIENSLRQRGGYALLGRRDVKNAQGLTGVELRFGHDEAQKPHLYTVTIFVTDSHIYLLEAGGSKEQMEANAKELARWVQGFSGK